LFRQDLDSYCIYPSISFSSINKGYLNHGYFLLFSFFVFPNNCFNAYTNDTTGHCELNYDVLIVVERHVKFKVNTLLGELCMMKNTALSWREVLSNDTMHTITGDVRVIEAFPIPQLQTERRVWIYLPRSYNESARRYPVLYMHDGQNVFDQATSWGSEWGVDETLEQLTIDEPELETIVVAIDNGGEQRNDEYNFTINAEYGFGGKGDDYATFLAETLKPYIDSHYRTLSGPEHTMIGGSSFGAYISLYTAIRYPTQFNRVSGISFVMWQDNGAIIRLIQQSVISPTLRLYLSIGELETDNPDFNRIAHEHITLVRQTLIAAGVADSRIRFDVIPDGTHHESTWGSLFAEAHRWLIQP